MVCAFSHLRSVVAAGWQEGVCGGRPGGRLGGRRGSVAARSGGWHSGRRCGVWRGRSESAEALPQFQAASDPVAPLHDMQVLQRQGTVSTAGSSGHSPRWGREMRRGSALAARATRRSPQATGTKNRRRCQHHGSAVARLYMGTITKQSFHALQLAHTCIEPTSFPRSQRHCVDTGHLAHLLEIQQGLYLDLGDARVTHT